MGAGAVKGNKCGNKKLNVRVGRISFSHINVRYEFEISRQRIAWVYKFHFSAVVMLM